MRNYTLNKTSPESSVNERPLSVTELTRTIKIQLESKLPRVQVSGEISNFTRQSSGHLYFTLKDAHSSLSCVMFRSSASRLNFDPRHGMQVTARGAIKVYEPRGQYQLQVSALQPGGQGNLHLELERRKKYYQEMGYFEESLKKALPILPRSIGIVTSPTGAAIRDILRVLAQRCSNGIDIFVVPAKVQGQGSAGEIASAIEILNKKKPDLIIIGRGGGSLEDLWAFNEEPVIEAVFHSEVPVISAVGHETDFTISDFVADYRAPTPSAAAEAAVPELVAVQNYVNSFFQKLAISVKGHLRSHRKSLEYSNAEVLQSRLTDYLNRYHQDLDYIQRSLLHNLKVGVHRKQREFENLGGEKIAAEIRRMILDFHQKLNHFKPEKSADFLQGEVDRKRLQLDSYRDRIQSELKLRVQENLARLKYLEDRLNSLNPEKVLELGYAFLRSKGKLVSSAEELQPAQELELQLKDGFVTTRVEGIKLKASDEPGTDNN